MRKRYVIIGASASGVNAASAIREHDTDGEILLFSEEKHLPYYRPHLSHYIGDKSVLEKPNHHIRPEKWYASQQIELKPGITVTAVDTEQKTVTTNNGQTVDCDRIIFATGSRPFVPVPGILERSNVFAIRTRQDADNVREHLKTSAHIAVIGGGLLGLEVADSLLFAGMNVTVVEMMDRLLPRQLDTTCSSLFKNAVQSAGARLMLGEIAETFEGDQAVTGINFKSGAHIDVDMVIFSIGVRPETSLAQASGLTVDSAVIVNDRMETDRDGVYACGDCAQFGREPLLWMPAVKQGRAAGANAAGENQQYRTSQYPAVLNTFGTKIYSAGEICDSHDDNVTVRKYEKADSLISLFFRDNSLSGGILINATKLSQKLLKGIDSDLTPEQTEDWL